MSIWADVPLSLPRRSPMCAIADLRPDLDLGVSTRIARHIVGPVDGVVPALVLADDGLEPLFRLDVLPSADDAVANLVAEDPDVVEGGQFGKVCGRRGGGDVDGAGRGQVVVRPDCQAHERRIEEEEEGQVGIGEGGAGRGCRVLRRPRRHRGSRHCRMPCLPTAVRLSTYLASLLAACACRGSHCARMCWEEESRPCGRCECERGRPSAPSTLPHGTPGDAPRKRPPGGFCLTGRVLGGLLSRRADTMQLFLGKVSRK